MTTSQLVASDVFPIAAVKTLLYPGAVAHGLVKNMAIPSWNDLENIYNLTSVKEAPLALDLKRLEVNLDFFFPPDVSDIIRFMICFQLGY